MGVYTLSYPDKNEILEEISRRIKECRKCDLWKTRRNAVPGEGNPNARVMFVGEAPGYHEDVQGRPFVGAAGQLLTKMIEDVLGVPRGEVYITNVVKCRPPGNRDPTEEEIELCSPYLIEQIGTIQPDIIVCLGRHSARFILSHIGVKFKSILSIRQKLFRVRLSGREFMVLATIHPAAALYKPPWRKFLEEDFRLLKEILRGKSERELPTLDSFLLRK